MINYPTLKNKNDFSKEKKINNANKGMALEEMINKYSGFSENKLMNEFIKLTLEKKKRGQLSNNELEGINEFKIESK